MKSAHFFSVALSLVIFVAATPTHLSSQALRIPLRRRSRNTGKSTSVQSATGEQSLGTQRVANLISYAYDKYANTLAAYERNTGLRHPLDMRSNSSSTGPSKRASNDTVSLKNQNVDLWYGPLTIGTPPQKFMVDFDTGSADLFVPATTCEGTCNGHQKYNPSVSNTSQTMDRTFVFTYGSGDVVGSQYDDTVGIGPYTIVGQRFGGADLFTPDLFAKNFYPDGISGLAFKEISQLDGPTLKDNLVKTGQLPQPVFGFKLSTDGGSELTIGAVHHAAFKSDTLVSIPVTKKGYWQVELEGLGRLGAQVRGSANVTAIIDTGITLILAPDDIVDNYYSGIQGANCNLNSVCTVPCNIIDSTAPTLTFGGKEFRVSPETWNLGPTKSGSQDCIAGLAKFCMPFVIVGDVFLRNVYSIFDFSEPPRIQFAELV